MGKFLDKGLSLQGILRLERYDESFLQSRPLTRCNGCSDFKAEDERAPFSASPVFPLFFTLYEALAYWEGLSLCVVIFFLLGLR